MNREQIQDLRGMMLLVLDHSPQVPYRARALQQLDEMKREDADMGRRLDMSFELLAPRWRGAHACGK